jgi:hypothetical protein
MFIVPQLRQAWQGSLLIFGYSKLREPWPARATAAVLG